MTKSQTEKADEVRAEAEGREIPEARGRARTDDGAPPPSNTTPKKLSGKKKLELLTACQIRIDGYKAKLYRLEEEVKQLKAQAKSAEGQREEIIRDQYQPDMFDDDDTETE